MINYSTPLRIICRNITAARLDRVLINLKKTGFVKFEFNNIGVGVNDKTRYCC